MTSQSPLLALLFHNTEQLENIFFLCIVAVKSEIQVEVLEIKYCKAMLRLQHCL